MRLGILSVLEWLTRGSVLGMNCENTRREIEKKWGTMAPEDTCVRYGDLEVSYPEACSLDVSPLYLMGDLFAEHRDRWREEIPWLSSEKRALAGALCTLRAPVIAEALRLRGIQVQQLPPPRRSVWSVAVGKGATMGCTFGEPELEGQGLTLFLTPPP